MAKRVFCQIEASLLLYRKKKSAHDRGRDGLIYEPINEAIWSLEAGRRAAEYGRLAAVD